MERKCGSERISGLDNGVEMLDGAAYDDVNDVQRSSSVIDYTQTIPY